MQNFPEVSESTAATVVRTLFRRQIDEKAHYLRIRSDAKGAFGGSSGLPVPWLTSITPVRNRAVRRVG